MQRHRMLKKKHLRMVFIRIEENPCIIGKDGETVRNAWIHEEDHWYYAGAGGRITAGWKKIDGVWYFFSPSGKLADGWIYEQDVWYYMTENGMLTGYQELDGNDFYFYEDGRLAVNVKRRMADWRIRMDISMTHLWFSHPLPITGIHPERREPSVG